MKETNCYATVVLDAMGSTMGGRSWEPLTTAGLKAFLSITMCIGMKKQPNIKTYWKKKGSFFHCPTISNIMTHARYFALRRCLHVTNLALYEHIQRGDLLYDKCRQMHWLINSMRAACKAQWSLGKYLTIDEMMIRYKGSYCPIRQYMPMKREKWGVKLWVLAESITKYVYNFEVYCGKIGGAQELLAQPLGTANSTYGVVMELLVGLEGRGHCLVLDNFFSSVSLFRDLVVKGIYATGMYL